MSKECTLNDENLIQACEGWVSKLCKTGGSAWSLSVPVDFNKDPDVLITELINRFKNYKNEQATDGVNDGY